MALAGQSSPAVIAPVALAAILARAAKMRIQTTPADLIAPDVAIDGLMTDAQQAPLTQVPGHLLRAPLFADQSVHPMQILEGEAQIAPRAGAPAAGTFNRFAGSIVPVEACAVTLELTRDGAA